MIAPFTATTRQRRMLNILLVCAALVCAGLAPGPARAQGGELPFGTPVEAVLNAGQTHTYTFRSEGEDTVSVRMQALDAGLDPVLALFDPAGALLAFSDDLPVGQPDAALEDVRLALPGVYTLVARSYGNRSGGAYTLEAASQRAATLDGSAPIAFGEAVQAELFVEEQSDRWWFEGRAGQIISARMDAARGAPLDPLLELLAADGTRLAFSDDEGGDKNSLINGFVLPADGQYVLLARAWGNMSTGEYTLLLVEGSLVDDPAS